VFPNHLGLSIPCWIFPLPLFYYSIGYLNLWVKILTVTIPTNYLWAHDQKVFKVTHLPGISAWKSTISLSTLLSSLLFFSHLISHYLFLFGAAYRPSITQIAHHIWATELTGLGKCLWRATEFWWGHSLENAHLEEREEWGKITLR
jgi:hypothetical protein